MVYEVISLVAYGNSTKTEQLLCHHNLERTPPNRLTPLQVVGKLDNIQQFYPILLVDTHILLQLDLQ